METKGTFASSCARAVRTKTGNYFKWMGVFAVTSALLLSSVISGYSAQATLSWDAVNDAGVAGYKLHYGKVPGVYTNSVDTGKTTSVTVNDLAEGETYYFASTAYDSKGNQSGDSNEVSKSIPATTQYSLMVAQNGIGTGTVTGSGINCGSVCTNGYAPGTVVNLTASPASGSTFAGWSGGGCSGTGTCTVTMNASTSITATFNSSAATYDITATASGNGMITALNNPNVSQGTSSSNTVSIATVTKGANQQFSITPATGNYTRSVSVDGTEVASYLGNYSYTFNSVTANHTIDATFAVATYSITPSAGSGGSISPTSASIDHGGSQSFTITPNSGYSVADVKVDGASVGAVTSYIFNNVTSNHTISATFTTAASSYAITASAASGGTISPAGTVAISGGTSKSFTLTPNSGYTVADVKVDGTSVGAVTSYTFSNINSNHTISATFTATTSSYSITASAASGGSISPAGTVSISKGASKSFTITPATGNYTRSVSVDGTEVASYLGNYSYTFNSVTANHTIDATFAVATYSITPSAGSGGSISPTSASIDHGGSQSFTITPNSGYSVADVKVDGASVGAVTSYIFNNVTSNHTISATFTTATSSYAITASAASGGTISPAGTVAISGGTSKSFTLTPNSGYTVADVKVDGTSVGAVTSYTFSNISSNHTISATFTATTSSYTITASAARGGRISPEGTVAISGGASRTFTILPRNRYHVSDVKVDGVSKGAISSYTFSSIVADHTIETYFSK